MIAGHYQGKFLEMLSFMIQPKHVLEIGCFTGYSALCWAKGLIPGGKVITIESNYELENMINKYVIKSGIQDQIELHIGNALEIIPTLDYEYDIVYIDAGKIDYGYFFDLVIAKVRKNGFIVADNVLWDGKVVMTDMDIETKALDDFNKKIKEDDRVENIILPIRDGINLIRKL